MHISYNKGIENERTVFIEELLNIFVYNLYLKIKPFSFFHSFITPKNKIDFSNDNIEFVLSEYFKLKNSHILLDILNNNDVITIKESLN